MFKVLDTDLTDNRIFQEYEEGCYNYWVQSVNAFWFKNTAHWKALNKATVLFETENFEEILPFLIDDLQNIIADVYIEVVELNVQHSILRESVEILFRTSHKYTTIDQCVSARRQVLEIRRLRKILLNVENYSTEVLEAIIED